MNALIVVSAKYLIFAILLAATFVAVRLDKSQRIRFCLWAVVAGAVALALTKLAGACFFDPRPFVVNHTVPLFPHEPDNGFPSDHTAVSMLVALLIIPFRKVEGFVLAFLALLVGVARVAAQVHSPLDIAGSILIAVLAWLVGRGAVSLIEGVRSRKIPGKPTV